MAVDACLSHGLRRRALGLFKTNSSTALIQKVAKSYKEAQDIMEMVEDEEKRILSEQQENARKLSMANMQQDNSNPTSCNRQTINQNKSPIKQQASNSNVYKRNLWIKCALIEKKLVSIVEYLAENASKYFEPSALMANYLCAQILSSLLVGPSALEFSKSKTSDYYQFDDPTAAELLKRHKLANPIACLCYSRNQQQQQQMNQKQTSKNPVKLSKSTDSTTANKEHTKLAITQNSLNIHTTNGQSPSLTSHSHPSTGSGHKQIKSALSSSMGRKENRRKPLALKTTNVKRGTLVTDCHHYSCQEISEHHQTRGYSFLCSSSNGFSSSNHSNQPTNQAGANSNHVCQTQDWSAWSPRMLHETLHQNSKSSLLYAKNNVLLETQPNETMAGYLSLHETNNDLILKWIPNQMINGGGSCNINHHANEQALNGADQVEVPERANDGDGDSSTLPHSVAVESSYLDLVVCLSVSRIVLLHCQFGKHKAMDEVSSSGEASDETLNDETRHSSTVETLILIEADGVQKSPFIFPKGGLRVFLSCLENGLRPNKYLDPAIKFDEEEHFDPLQSYLTSSGLEGEQESRISTPESPIPSSFGDTFAGGKLDMLLKRLPSLKRPTNKPTSDTSNIAQSNDHLSSANSECSPSTTSATPTKQTNHIKQHHQTNHYVYRIVSTQQPDWPLQTPPHSALSVGSASSGSFPLNGNKQASNQNSTQKFRWSLSKLARFSSKYTQQNGSTSSSSDRATNYGCRQQISSINSVSTANGSLGSLLSFHQFSVGNTNVESGSIQSDNVMLAESSASLELTSTLQEKTSRSSGSQNVDEYGSKDLVRIEAKLNDLKQSTSDDVLQALRTQSIQTLCESMRKQILARAFYGWLVYCRKAKIIRTHLVRLIKDEANCFLINYEDTTGSSDNIGETICVYEQGLTRNIWNQLMKEREKYSESELCLKVNQFVYYGGIESDDLRREVWPYLLEHYKFKDDHMQKKVRDEIVREAYNSCGRDWIKIERVVKERDSELLAANMAKVSNCLKAKKFNNQIVTKQDDKATESREPTDNTNNVDSTNNISDEIKTNEVDGTTGTRFKEKRLDSLHEMPDTESIQCDSEDVDQLSDKDEEDNNENETNQAQNQEPSSKLARKTSVDLTSKRRRGQRRYRLESTGSVGSDASITDHFGNNIHRIDKDVQRCDRNFWYFKETKNLDKLRNIMCSYVWQHLDVGYVQGMCDLAAPFLVIFDDEVLAFSCFSQLMKRMVANFPHGSAMDQHFESLKYLMQVLDPKLYEILQSNGDYTHFYFCYRWLLLDFKRGKLLLDLTSDTFHLRIKY